MTYQELLDEVICLGFEDSVENESQFKFAANRALKQIFCEMPERRIAKIQTSSPPAFVLGGNVLLSPGETYTLPVTSGGVSFTVGGRGNVVLCVGAVSSTKYFDKDGVLCRLICPSVGTLTIHADGYVSVGEISFYEGTFTLESDIPDGEKRQINLSLFADDFLFCDRVVTDGKGNGIPGALVYGGTLYLPKTCAGTVIVEYCRKPEEISGDDPDAEIDLSARACFLLPLLTAAYLYLDSDSEKATYYMSLFRDGIARIQRTVPKDVGAPYADVTKW